MYELQLQAYQNQLEILRSANEDYRTLRHDMKHHIVMLTDFIYKGENEKALEYLGKISSYAAGNRGYVETGNVRDRQPYQLYGRKNKRRLPGRCWRIFTFRRGLPLIILT